MAQLKLDNNIVKTEWLKDCIDESMQDVESSLPEAEDTSLSLSLRKISKHVFSADFHAKLFGRLLIVSAKDSNLARAIAKSRRNLMRQIEDLRALKRAEIRHRPSRRERVELRSIRLMPVKY